MIDSMSGAAAIEHDNLYPEEIFFLPHVNWILETTVATWIAEVFVPKPLPLMCSDAAATAGSSGSPSEVSSPSTVAAAVTDGVRSSAKTSEKGASTPGDGPRMRFA